MTNNRDSQNDLHKLIHDFVVAGESGELTEDRWADFERLLRESDEACRLYAEYMDVSLSLPLILDTVPEEESPPSDIVSSEQQEHVAPPPPLLPSNAIHGPGNLLLSGWPMVYLIATVLIATVFFGLGAVVGSVTRVPRPEQVAERLPGDAKKGQALPEREVSPSIIKTFDLVDVVAGGDGFSGRRNASIDPTTGRRNTEAFIRKIQVDESVLYRDGGPYDDKWAVGDGEFHRAEELPFVDGVFIPDGSKGPVTVDSVGHAFADCPKTLNYAPLLIWGGGAIPEAGFPYTTTVSGYDYGRNGHGLLWMHANLGITFDLRAIRKANPDWTVRRFLAMATVMELRSKAGSNVYADYWVLVDGRVRSHREQINARDELIPISVSIDSSDRFLTLVSTDGGNGINCDNITFIDPQLELSKEEYQATSQEPPGKVDGGVMTN